MPNLPAPMFARTLAAGTSGRNDKEDGNFCQCIRCVFIVYPGSNCSTFPDRHPSSMAPTVPWASEDKPPFYKISLASAQGGVVESSSGVALETRPIAELRPGQAQTVLVVGGRTRTPHAGGGGSRLCGRPFPQLVAQAERFGSVCTGGFVLAALGLLDGRRVATHWDSCKPFTNAFPKVRVDPDALYVVDDRLWTSAGVTTGIDMALAMVARDLDATIAGDVAKRLVLYARRPGYQSQFSPVLAAQVKGDSPFADLIGWMQSNLDAQLDVTSLAARAGLTERTFHRKFSGGDRRDTGSVCRDRSARRGAHAAVARAVDEVGRGASGPVPARTTGRSFRTPLRRRAATIPRHARRTVSADRQLLADIVEKVRSTREQALATESHFMARLYPELGFGAGLLAERYSTQRPLRL